ncbi:hypothetical protein Curi_c24850 [Gottschalkia acidurici 9a]|uniref:Lipoprotein n=1 Tax=Gottschalkia acidurici (strain ATCC 7906 / DSM 604 / BCRC 14475 / CIP 104303 / KCTC 5404 / NCIMB 10678 / 9a) TaxID=1128398 RepID=K0B3N8_GOTA9|nr:hypothetical protein [Gottschalkia acidurici]AFS79480.1 hypothetical protein Curi_c24850 [Gottschalkia acidurici 9a]
MKNIFLAVILFIMMTSISACNNIKEENMVYDEINKDSHISYPLAKTKVSDTNTFERTVYPNTSQKYYKMWYENNSQYSVTIGLYMNGERVRNLNIEPYQSDGLVGDFTVQHKKYYNQNFEYRVLSQNGYNLNGYATFGTNGYGMEK